MDKKELIIFGLLAVVAVLLLYQFAWPKQFQKIVTIEQPAAIPEQLPVMPEIPPQAAPVPEVPSPQPEPTIPEIPLAPEAAPQVPSETPEEESGLIFGEGLSAAAQQPTPTKENLIPAYTEFQVNKLMIPEYFGYEFIPIKKDNIRTFAGKFGPYYYDYRPYIYAELCSFISNQPEMFACEKANLNYINNYLTFVNGYKPDEFIGNVAMKNFGTYYLVRSKEHGLLAKSNVATIKIVNN